MNNYHIKKIIVAFFPHAKAERWRRLKGAIVFVTKHVNKLSYKEIKLKKYTTLSHGNFLAVILQLCNLVYSYI